MTLRWSIYVAFVLTVFLLSILCYKKFSSKMNWRANIDLPLNARISTNYLAWNGRAPIYSWGIENINKLEGKYIALTNVPAGGEISPDNLSDFPHLCEMTNEVIFFYPSTDLALGLADIYLNTGAKLSVCSLENGSNYGPYRLEAVLGKSQPFLLALRVTNSDAEILTSIAKPQLRLVSLQ